ncbi:hypothetical protein [Streptomyces sp. NPDC005408]|uniref:hypothetical protein n=1 Tax=Streptomyces sp. NPDC005408 TaxID=3155341 RepID=UPI0033AAB5EF
MMTTQPDPAASHSLDLRAAASRLALLNDVANTGAPAEVLYNIAGNLDALRHPVTALGGSDTVVKALADAAAAVRDLMGRH